MKVYCYEIIRLPFVIILMFALFSCETIYKNKSTLENALELAGSNRSELEKVLSLYSKGPSDSLKYKAACFLIENMVYYSYYEGETLDNYKEYARELRKNKFTSLSPQEISNEIVSTYGVFSYNKLMKKEDIQTIDSTYLCNNIEWAFKVWEEQPWGKNIIFEDFCEYILPYRIGNEKIEYWREKYYHKYNKLLDSLRESDLELSEDPINAVYALMDHITDRDSIYFTTVSPANLPNFGPTMVEFKSGNCRELTDFVVYVCRSLGIPCHIDFYPIRGNDNVGHFWVSFYDKKQQLYSQDFPEGVGNITKNGIKKDSKAKVYRNTFSINKEIKEDLLACGEDVPSLFELPLFIDVTAIYSEHIIDKWSFPTSKLYTKSDDMSNRIIYLCNAQHMYWEPVAYTTFEKNNLEIEWINKGSVMRLASWENDRLEFWSDPFQINPKSNELIYYTPEDTIHSVTLFSKFDVWAEDLFRRRMLGGVFEGSDNHDFSVKDTIYVINKVHERLINKINIDSNTKYKYIRYYGPQDAFCNVSEIAIFENRNDSIPLSGEIIGTPGSFEEHKPQEYSNAFDGKTWTSFNYKEAYGGWAGIMFDEPKRVSEIEFTYRNYDNFIRPGDVFELFYCDKEWKSLGVIECDSDSLVYANIPLGSLLYLKNHTRGNQERIFSINENGKQIFK